MAAEAARAGSLHTPLAALIDTAHVLGSLAGPQERIERVLGLLGALVPNDGCALIEQGDGEQRSFTFFPRELRDVPRIKETLTDCLKKLSRDAVSTITYESRPDIAGVVPWRSYAGVPVIGVERTLGLLFVVRDEPNAFSESDFQLLALVASQVGAYLGALHIRKREQALAEQMRFQARMLDSINQAVFATNPDRNIVYWNHAAEELFGWKAGDAIGRPLNEVVPPSPDGGAEIRERVMAGETWSGQLRYRRRDGSLFPAFVVAWPMYDGEGAYSGAVAVIADITEMRRMQEELEHAKAYVDRLFDSRLIGILEANPERITAANDAFLDIVGYTRQDLEECGIDWRAITPPEFAYLDEAALDQLRVYGETTPFEKEYIRKDGTRVPILIGGALIHEEPMEWVCFVLDLTQQKKAQEQLDRMRSEFIGTISHELKTPLTAIKGSVAIGLSERTPPSPEEARELFIVIDEQSERLRELIVNLLDMTRIEANALPVRPEKDDLESIIEDARTTFVRGSPRHRVNVQIDGSLPPVKADRRRIVQVLTNLLRNAADASPEPATITVSAESDGDCVTVRVQDRGRGIPADKLPIVFEKFVQIHPTGRRGTGLGLPISKGIVEAHGGRIWADSPGEGRGATFSFTLPIYQE
ncbi:MAG: PAS domain S-box protein [Dehalococcoidia bacterium]|nr:PAS domain S-box protein [Dehalococcoidia bacterium]